jgi:hypothetical protein
MTEDQVQELLRAMTICARASFRLTADWRQPVGITNHGTGGEAMTAMRVSDAREGGLP